MAEQPQASAAILDSTKSFVKEYTCRYDSSHDWSHMDRVTRLAEHIAEVDQVERDIRYDLTIVRLAALLHDVGDAKYAQPEDPPDPVRQFLLSKGAGDDLAMTVQDIVDQVSFSKEQKDPDAVQRVLAEHPELAAVQDADRLDAIGATGVGRCFTYNAAYAERARVGPASPSVPSNSMTDAIEHFDDKLIKLGSMMKTQEGRRMAEKRTERLIVFRDWWFEEQRGFA